MGEGVAPGVPPARPAFRLRARRICASTCNVVAVRASLAARGRGLPAPWQEGRGPTVQPSIDWRLTMFRILSLCAVCAIPSMASAASPSSAAMAVPPDASRWELEGKAKIVEHQGRPSIFLDGGAATLKGLEMRDAVIDVDVSTPASRVFFGIQFRVAEEGRTAEWV